MKRETECAYCGEKILRIPTKSGRSFCATECKANWQKLQKPVTKEWLIQKYEVEGLDCTKIGKIVSRDPKSVWNWLMDFGIKTRKRGTTDNWRHVKNPYWKGRKMPEETREKIRQARLKDGRIPAYINGVHWLHHYKDRKPAAWKGGVSPERQAVYGTKEWKRTAQKVWARDKKTCQNCGKVHKHGDASFDIHHIVGFENKELRMEMSNLVLLCEPCHYWVHGKKNKTKKFLSL